MDQFDLHTHSTFSDGSDTPADIVRAAAKAGLRLMALTDHDATGGVAEAQREGERLGLRVLAGLEFDCASSHELHLQGLDVDPACPALAAALAHAAERRHERNEKILRQLSAAGCEIRPFVRDGGGSVTRLNIALALVDAGFARTVREAFARYLVSGCAGFVPGFRETCIQPADAIEVIHAAGGCAVWAHPMHAPADVHKLAKSLADAGLDGIEAYHPSASEGDAALLVSLAAQHGLFVSCGSDYHGAYRPGVQLGCTWRDCPPLQKTFDRFMQ